MPEFNPLRGRGMGKEKHPPPPKYLSGEHVHLLSAWFTQAMSKALLTHLCKCNA